MAGARLWPTCCASWDQRETEATPAIRAGRHSARSRGVRGVRGGNAEMDPEFEAPRRRDGDADYQHGGGRSGGHTEDAIERGAAEETGIARRVQRSARRTLP